MRSQTAPPRSAPARPDPDRYAALRSSCARLPAGEHALLRLSGEDRVRFLQGLVTCDVDAAQVDAGSGAGTWGFFTTGKGRILADVAVLAGSDSLWLRVPAAEAEAVREHVLHYRIADRVELDPAVGWTAVRLAGPGADAIVTAEGWSMSEQEPPAEPWSTVEGRIGGAALRIVREGHLGVPGLTVWAESETAAQLAAVLDERSDLVTAGEAEAEAIRIEGGIPRYGVDYGSEHFPQETGLGDAAVSYTKGCYLGQEIVARIHYRGGVKRGLAGLRLPSELVESGLQPGTALLHDGREAGRLTSLAYSPQLDSWIGLSILHERASTPDEQLAAEGYEESSPVEVAQLPLVQP